MFKKIATLAVAAVAGFSMITTNSSSANAGRLGLGLGILAVGVVAGAAMAGAASKARAGQARAAAAARARAAAQARAAGAARQRAAIAAQQRAAAKIAAVKQPSVTKATEVANNDEPVAEKTEETKKSTYKPAPSSSAMLTRTDVAAAQAADETEEVAADTADTETASEGDAGELSDETPAAKTASCKRFFPALGVTLSVACN